MLDRGTTRPATERSAAPLRGRPASPANLDKSRVTTARSRFVGKPLSNPSITTSPSRPEIRSRKGKVGNLDRLILDIANRGKAVDRIAKRLRRVLISKFHTGRIKPQVGHKSTDTVHAAIQNTIEQQFDPRHGRGLMLQVVNVKHPHESIARRFVERNFKPDGANGDPCIGARQDNILTILRNAARNV